jgi:hypothetical protein
LRVSGAVTMTRATNPPKRIWARRPLYDIGNHTNFVFMARVPGIKGGIILLRSCLFGYFGKNFGNMFDL